MQKFLEIPRRVKNFDSENLWFNHCQRQSIPFIIVKPATKYADVHWDYITYHPDIDDVLHAREKELKEKATAIFMKYANEKSEYLVNASLIYYDRLGVDEAKKAAAELFDLISDIVQSGVSAA